MANRGIPGGFADRVIGELKKLPDAKEILDGNSNAEELYECVAESIEYEPPTCDVP